MKNEGAAQIRKLPTGVPGLDDVLGGGVPEYSFSLIAGESGAGKTTLAQQIIFRNAREGRGAIYFTVLGETAIKMLRYQQQYSFFDPAMVNGTIRFVNLGDEVLKGDLGAVLDRIIREVEERSPAVVVVDSIRTLEHSFGAPTVQESEFQGFVQRLAVHLTSWQVTSFLIGEYGERERESSPVFTIADGLVWLTQAREGNSVVRKLQVVKGRGQAHMPGLHTFRITGEGIRVFPRITAGADPRPPRTDGKRLSIGLPVLDEMMGGGIPEGDAVLVAGPTGSGKSILATHFVTGGAEAGEAGVLAVFEEHPKDFLARAQALGFDVEGMVEAGTFEAIYLRPLDLSPDEALHEIREAVARVGAKRVAIDSLSGFELALAPTFRTEFRESLYRLIAALTEEGITVLTTVTLANELPDISITPTILALMADDLVLLRYVETHGEFRKALAVGKMRGSQHSKIYREYRISAGGIELGHPLHGLEESMGKGFPDRRSG